jgi:hypothetical protein
VFRAIRTWGVVAASEGLYRTSDRHDADVELGSMMANVCGETGYWGAFNKISCYGDAVVYFMGVNENTTHNPGPP